MVDTSDLDERDLEESRRAVLDAIETPAAVVDATGVVRLVNAAWNDFGRANEMADETCGIGGSYATWSEDRSDADARRASDGVFEVISGRADAFQVVYPCHSDTEERWFRLVVAPLAVERPRPVLTVHVRLADRYGAGEYAEPTPTVRPVVCAWCQTRRRDDDGRWVDLDDPSLLAENVSHGICEDCVERFA